jgi:hypothetical protein
MCFNTGSLSAKRLNETELLNTKPVQEPQVKNGEQSVHPSSLAGILDVEFLGLIELPWHSLSVQQGFADSNII